MNVNALSDGAKYALWCAGACNQMKAWGLIGGGRVALTVEGQATWDQIDMELKPSDEQIQLFAETTSSGEETEGLVLLLREFRDDREEMLAFVESEGEKP